MPEEPEYIRTSKNKMVNFYKSYDIHSYRKPVFKTKIIKDARKQIDRYDYFYNQQGYIIKESDEVLAKKLKKKRMTRINAQGLGIDLPVLMS